MSPEDQTGQTAGRTQQSRPRERRETSGDGQRRPSSGQDHRRRFQRRRFVRQRKVCRFCVDKVDVVDYRDAALLRRFLTDHGKILARRKTGTCAKHQRRLAMAIKLARHLALLPYTGDQIREMSES